MSRIVFDFSQLITNCLHNKEEKFTNSIRKKAISKSFLTELFCSLQSICRDTEK